MSSKTAKQERGRLEQAIRDLGRVRVEADRQAALAGTEVERLQGERRLALAAVARSEGGAQSKADEISVSIRAKEAEQQQSTELARIADTERKAAEQELNNFLAKTLDHWIREAEKLAHDELASRDPILEAIANQQVKAGTVSAEWNVLKRAVSSQQAIETISDANSETGTTTVQRGYQDLGGLPPQLFDGDITEKIRTAPRIEPASIRTARRGGILDRAFVPRAVREWFGRSKPTASSEPNEDQTLVEVIDE